ncbi:MAG TPA: polyhydroxyalkanoate synthesis regulator DNA-binding domain-containing protein [Chloroflexia bacterium]|nr:polyhydroxyalkanoate synthesis regulator DNA-binding domain-containing protein [Chloroflexia bacterium]
MRLIKRYSNRKLYDTTTRTYITLEGIAGLVVEGVDIKVVDNDTDEDLTTVILSQILLERERSRRSLSSGLLSGLLRSGESLGRGLSSITRPLTPGGMLNFLEHEMDRSLKFWLEIGQDSEEEVLRLIEGLIEKRRRMRNALQDAPNGSRGVETTRSRPAGPGLLRRQALDDFEPLEEVSGKPAARSPDPAEMTILATHLSEQAAGLANRLQKFPPDTVTARRVQAELSDIEDKLAEIRRQLD